MSIMKIFVLTTFIVCVVGGPVVKTWTLDELEKILHDKTYDPEQKPYLEKAYNLIIFSMFTNNHLDLTSYSLPPPKGVSKWTMEEMEKAIKDPTTNPKFLPALHEYYEYWKNTRDFGDKPVDSIEVHVRGMDISTWTLPELREAIANPETNSLLLPYLETARTKLTSDPDFQDKTTISIVTKIGLVKKDKNVEQSTLNQV